MKFKLPHDPTNAIPNNLREHRPKHPREHRHPKTGSHKKPDYKGGRMPDQAGPNVDNNAFLNDDNDDGKDRKTDDNHSSDNEDLSGMPKVNFNPLINDLSGANKPHHRHNGEPKGHDANHSKSRKPHDKDNDGSHRNKHSDKDEDKNPVQNALDDANPLKKGKHSLSHSLGELAGGKNKHSPTYKLAHALNPLNHKINGMQNEISHDAKHAGYGLHGLVNHGQNILRRGKLVAMEGVRNLGSTMLRALTLSGGGVLGGFFGAFGKAFKKIGKATGTKPRTAGTISLAMLALFGIFWINDLMNNQYMDNVGCAIEKVADDEGLDTPVSGTNGQWSQKGTKAYNSAKAAYAELKKDGLNDAQAAGAMGGCTQEDPSFNPLEPNQTGDGGLGYFQITPKASGVSLQQWCEQHHRNIRSPEAQADCYYQTFLKHGGYTSTHGSVEHEAWEAASIEAHGTVNAGLAPDSNFGQRLYGAKKMYQMFNGVGGSAANDNDAAASDSSDDDACSKAGQDAEGTSNSDIINYAEKYLHLPYDEEPWRDQGAEDVAAGKPKSQCKPTDCAGFTWGVLKHLGYKTTSSPWITTNEYSFSGIKHVSANQTGAGTVLDENDNGDPHTGFLKEKWQGKATKIIDEDGGSALGHCVGNNTYGTAFYGCYGTPEFLQGEK